MRLTKGLGLMAELVEAMTARGGFADVQPTYLEDPRREESESGQVQRKIHLSDPKLDGLAPVQQLETGEMTEWLLSQNE